MHVILMTEGTIMGLYKTRTLNGLEHKLDSGLTAFLSEQSNIVL